MKKLTISMLMIFVICIINTVNVFAADVTAELNIDKTTVKAGDTVTVTLNAKCESGLSAVITGIEYDKEVLTLQTTKVAENWVNYGVDKYEILSNSTEKVTSLNVITLTFKVSDNAQDGTTKISTTGIEITDINNKEYTLDKSEKVLTIGNPTPSEPEENPTQVTLTNIKITKAPIKTTYTEGEKFDKTGMVVTAEYSDGTSKEITNYTYTPSEALNTTDKKITISYTEGEVTKTVAQEITVINAPENNTEDNKEDTKEDVKDDSSKSDKEIPKAGVEKNIILVIGVVLIVTMASYLGYKKYKNI